MSATDSSQDTYSPPPWIRETSQVRDAAVFEAPAPAVYNPIESRAIPDQDSHETLREPLPSRRPQPHPEKLTLLQLENWDPNREYDEDPPTCLHYSIEWKVTVNGKMRWKDTEQDLVLAPAPYWQLFIQPKLEEQLRKKLLRPR